jgi:hypothetical protein
MLLVISRPINIGCLSQILAKKTHGEIMQFQEFSVTVKLQNRFKVQLQWGTQITVTAIC